MSEDNHNQIREAFEPFRLALEKNETDTLGRLLSDDERLFSMAGSWTQSITVTLGDLRKLAKSINSSPIEDTPNVPPVEWTTSSPSEAGWYVYQLVGQWPMHTGQVRPGNWRLAQDPSRMYCGDIVVDSMEAYWFGPIHEPKKP